MPLNHATLPPCLKELTVDELLNRIERLIEDWHSPTLSPLGLCRMLDLSIAQLRALITLPLFAAILDDIRFIQNARREWIHTRAADHAFDRLVYLTHQTPTSAASCNEIRLAAKAILEITGPPASQTDGPTSSRPSDSVTPPMQSADSDAPKGHAHDESLNRGGGVPNASAQRARSVSEGVIHDPEASAPGLSTPSSQPRPERSASTAANESAAPDELHAATTPPSPSHLPTPNDAPIVQAHQPPAADHQVPPGARPCAHSSS